MFAVKECTNRMQILVTTKTRNGKCDAVQRLREKGQSERVYESEWVSHFNAFRWLKLNGNARVRHLKYFER